MAQDPQSTSELQKNYAKIVARAWRDEGFKKRLVSDPGSVLKEGGLYVAPNRTVKVVEQTNEVFYFMLPQRPANLTDEQLDSPDTFMCNATECDICATEAGKR
jgi:hypothetical protein